MFDILQVKIKNECSWNIFCQNILDSLDMSEVDINIEKNIRVSHFKGVIHK